jgi:hypothetical protein
VQKDPALRRLSAATASGPAPSHAQQPPSPPYTLSHTHLPAPAVTMGENARAHLDAGPGEGGFKDAYAQVLQQSPISIIKSPISPSKRDLLTLLQPSCALQTSECSAIDGACDAVMHALEAAQGGMAAVCAGGVRAQGYEGYEQGATGGKTSAPVLRCPRDESSCGCTSITREVSTEEEGVVPPSSTSPALRGFHEAGGAPSSKCTAEFGAVPRKRSASAADRLQVLQKSPNNSKRALPTANAPG